MRYYIHARRGGSTYVDTQGACVSSADEAKAHAERVADELAVGGSWRCAWLHVVDENGEDVGRVQIDPD